MGVELQVMVSAKNGYHKGDVIYIHEGPDYHLGPSLPLFLNVIVTDVVLSDIEPLLQPLEHGFAINYQGNNCGISRKYVSSILTQEQKDKAKSVLKAELQLEDSDFNITDNLIIFPKNGYNKAQIDGIFSDLLTWPDIPRKFRINPTIVDTQVNADNHTVEITFAQLQANVINKATKI